MKWSHARLRLLSLPAPLAQWQSIRLLTERFQVRDLDGAPIIGRQFSGQNSGLQNHRLGFESQLTCHMLCQLNWLEHSTYGNIGELEDLLQSSYKVCKFKSCYSHQIERFRVRATGGAPCTSPPLNAIADGIIVCQIMRDGEVSYLASLMSWRTQGQSLLPQPYAPMDKLAKLSAFHAGDRGSNPLGSTIWLCGRTGRVAALSRRSLWDRAPPESPDSNNWFCQNIEALILNSPFRGTTTVITITNMLFLGQPRGQL